VLRGVASGSRIPLPKRIALLAVAACCGALRCRWRQRGVSSTLPSSLPRSLLFTWGQPIAYRRGYRQEVDYEGGEHTSVRREARRMRQQDPAPQFRYL
jgi:hypothetical protein